VLGFHENGLEVVAPDFLKELKVGEKFALLFDSNNGLVFRQKGT